MYIKIIGKPRKKDISVNTIRDAIAFFGEYLVGQKMANNINITVNLKKFPTNSNDYAYCDWEFNNHNSRDFIITIDNNLIRREVLMALAHKMVHVKQYVKGEMKDLFRPVRMVKWFGEKYYADGMDYWEQPWEIEAYGREKGMYHKFIDYERKGKKNKITKCSYFNKGYV